MRGDDEAGEILPELVQIELKPLGADGTLIITAAGDHFEILAPPDELWDVLRRCDGSRTLTEVLKETPDPVGYGEVLAQLIATGGISVGAASSAASHWSRFGGAPIATEAVRDTTLVLLGDDALVDIASSLVPAGSFGAVEVSTADALPAVLDADAANRVVLVVRNRLDVDFLLWLNDLCAQHRTSWSQFHVAQGHGWAGPAVRPRFSPDYRDLLGRRRTAAERLDVYEALIASTVFGTPYLPPAAELRWMLGFLLIDLERLVSGAPCQTSWAEVELDPVNLAVVRHPLLQLPDRPLDPSVVEPRAEPDFESLVDSRTGLVTGLPEFRHHESIPARLVTVQSNVADMRRLYPWANNTVCGGSKFDDPEGARLSAIGEAVERYCGNSVSGQVDIRETSFAELAAAGEYAVNPERLVLYSDRLYDSPGFPFVRFAPELTTHWVQGHSLTRGRPVWVPASTVYVNWYTDTYAELPPTNFLYYPGIAAGPSLDWAVASGIEEIIERDITMIWWMNRHQLPRVRPTPELAALWAGAPEEAGQRYWLIHLDNEFGVPVMAGVVVNDKEGLVNIGFAARPDPVDAARKAWTEALTLQDGSRDFNQPGGLTRQAIAEGWVSLELKPWRADRRYLDEYAADFHDVNDLMNQQQVFLDPRAIDVVRPWLEPPGERDFASVPRLSNRSTATYRRLVEARGYEVIYVDVTTQDAARAGLKVVRVLIPGLVPNFPAAFPFLGNRRIQDAPVQLGWRESPLAEEDLNYFPLAHA